MKHSYPSVADIVDSFRCLLVRSFVRSLSFLSVVPHIGSCPLFLSSFRPPQCQCWGGEGEAEVAVVVRMQLHTSSLLVFDFAVGNHTRWSTVFLYVYSYAFSLSLAEPIDAHSLLCVHNNTYLHSSHSFHVQLNTIRIRARLSLSLPW